MGLEELISAFEEFMKVRKEGEAESNPPCDDWDCELAAGLTEALVAADQKERMNKAASALESALNRYIDDRIDAVRNR